MTGAPRLCPSCRAMLPLDASFCPRCGEALAGGVRPARRGPVSVPVLFIAVGAVAAVIVALGLVVWRGKAVPKTTASVSPAGVSGVAGATAAGAIPDISGLSPKERFDRLYGRLIQALRAGDTATLSRLAPMALGAYAMLDSTNKADSLTRHRAEVLRLHLSDTVTPRRTSVAP